MKRVNLLCILSKINVICLYSVKSVIIIINNYNTNHTNNKIKLYHLLIGYISEITKIYFINNIIKLQNIQM